MVANHQGGRHQGGITCGSKSASLGLAAQVGLELREHAEHVQEALARGCAGVDGLLGGLEGKRRAPARCERYPAGRRCSGRGDQYRSNFAKCAAGASLAEVSRA
jgi:hypothetical protein